MFLIITNLIGFSLLTQQIEGAARQNKSHFIITTKTKENDNRDYEEIDILKSYFNSKGSNAEESIRRKLEKDSTNEKNKKLKSIHKTYVYVTTEKVIPYKMEDYRSVNGYTKIDLIKSFLNSNVSVSTEKMTTKDDTAKRNFQEYNKGDVLDSISYSDEYETTNMIKPKENAYGKDYVIFDILNTYFNARKLKQKQKEQKQGSKIQRESSCQCGKAKRKRGKEISGGYRAVRYQFPWMVKLVGGCPRGACGGALVSPRIVLTAHHCTVDISRSSNQSCDHSDHTFGKRLAILGQTKLGMYKNNIDPAKLAKYYTIPVVQALSPPHAPVTKNAMSHDFAMLVLETPAEFSKKVRPICLPHPHAEYGGKYATAAGWGKTDDPSINPYDSPYLKYVYLKVNPRIYRHKKMFGTFLTKKNNQFQDPCSGDSGGPLMFLSGNRYTIIGTVMGSGYDCRTGGVKRFEGQRDGVWNKVSAHMEWIQDKMREIGEKICR